MADVETILALYGQGMSLPDVAEKVGKGMSTVRYHVKKAGILRTRTEGIRGSGHKISKALKGKERGPMSEETKNKLRHSALERNDLSAKGYRTTSQGYNEFTRGPHKGQMVHRVITECALGRPLEYNEVVHHIDGNKTNNNLDNLKVMDSVEHIKFHREQDHNMRRRESNGRFA